MKKTNKKNKGFVSIEIMVGLGIVSIITVQGMLMLDNFNKSRMARNVGEHIKIVGEASNKYINTFQNELAAFAQANSQAEQEAVKQKIKTSDEYKHFTNIFNHISCASKGTEDNPLYSCNLDIQELKNAKLIAERDNVRTPFGSEYDIKLNIGFMDKAKKFPMIRGLVVTKTPWTRNGAANGPVNYALLGEAVHQAGVDAGFTALNNGVGNPQVIKGYKGSWELNRQDYSNINHVGALAYRFGYHSGDMNAYLRRDGTLPMTGNLNMGGNDIDNAKDIKAKGDLYADDGKFNGKVLFKDPEAPNQQEQDMPSIERVKNHNGIKPVLANEFAMGGNNALMINNEGGKLFITKEEVATNKWLCSENEITKKICMGGTGHDKNGGNFEIKYYDNRPLLVHNTASKKDNNSLTTINADGSDTIVFRIGGSGAVHDNLYVGDRTHNATDKDPKDQFKVNNKDISKRSGHEGGNIISNYSINYGSAVIKQDKKPSEIIDKPENKFKGYTDEGANPIAVELTKDGDVIASENVIAKSFFIKDVPNNAGDSKFTGGLSIKQIIPSYSSRGAFVVYDEDYVEKPDCKAGITDIKEKEAARQGVPKIILSWGNIHTSGDEVDESTTNATTTNNPANSPDKFLRKHRVILKAEDVGADGDAKQYWRVIVKTRSFDGSKWVSAGQAVAQIYCQLY